MMILATALAMALHGTELPPVVDGTERLASLAPELSAMPEVQLSYYEVSGRNPRAIRQAMDQVRPRYAGEGHYDAVTTWRFSWRINQRSGTCDPAKLEVRVAVNVLLPQLTEYNRLSRSDRNRWDRYFEALVGHETDHARIAIDGAAQLQSELRTVPDCAALEAEGERLVEAIAEASRLYDEVTRNGRLQGAVFP